MLFPKRCVGCRSFGFYLCEQCESRLIRPNLSLCLVCDRPAIDGVTHPSCRTRYTPDGSAVAFVFGSPIKEVIHELKYHGVTDIVALCSLWICELLPTQINPNAVLIPMPLHKQRQNERGFNQAALIAKQVGIMKHLPIDETSLIRKKNTISQTMLEKEQRKKNMTDAFICHKSLKGKVVYLIDDTITTGATMVAATNALKRVGAKEVWCLALAQAMPAWSKVAN